MATPASEPKVAFDTNILVYAMNVKAEHHEACFALRDCVLRRELSACVSAQVLFEYFAVVTNPNYMTVPLPAEDALADLEAYAQVLEVLQTPEDIASRVVALMRASGFSGRSIFDVQIAATLLANGVSQIYTYDQRFEKITGVTVLSP